MAAFFDYLLGREEYASDAPLDPTTGLRPADRRQAGINTLANISRTLMEIGAARNPREAAAAWSMFPQAAGTGQAYLDALTKERRVLQQEQGLRNLMKDPEQLKSLGLNENQIGLMRFLPTETAAAFVAKAASDDPLKRELTQAQIRKAQTITAGDNVYQLNKETGKYDLISKPQTGRKPPSNTEVFYRSIIAEATNNPALLNNPEYSSTYDQAYNAIYGEQLIDTVDPLTGNTVTRWMPRPAPSNVPLPSYLRGVSAAPGGVSAAPAVDQQPGSQPSVSPGIVKKQAAPPTEAQSKAMGFARRMIDAQSVLNPLDLTEHSVASNAEYFAESSPIAPKRFVNEIITDERRRYRQAQENWVSANLRRESGAVIGVEEMEQEIRKYFPQPGDDPLTIMQKQQVRNAVTQAMIDSAGDPGKRAGLEFKPYEQNFEDKLKTSSSYDLLNIDLSVLSNDEKTKYLNELRRRNIR